MEPDDQGIVSKSGQSIHTPNRHPLSQGLQGMMFTTAETESGVQGLTNGKVPLSPPYLLFRISWRLYFTELIAPLDYQSQVGPRIRQDYSNV